MTYREYLALGGFIGKKGWLVESERGFFSMHYEKDLGDHQDEIIQVEDDFVVVKIAWLKVRAHRLWAIPLSSFVVLQVFD
jgi:hypothetical protein